MEDHGKVYVFERKEVFLLLMFVFIMGVTCFTLGLRLGKQMGLDKSGVTNADQAAVEAVSSAPAMQSATEEEADKALAENTKSDDEKIEALMEKSKEQLNDELGKFQEAPAATTPTQVESEKPPTAQTNVYGGKYTIQLGSYNTAEEAKQFAEGFTVRGYNPIVNEVTIPGKGVWYRVSLGVFETVAEAKEYIKKEQTLFQGQDHVISEIK